MARTLSVSMPSRKFNGLNTTVVLVIAIGAILGVGVFYFWPAVENGVQDEAGVETPVAGDAALDATPALMHAHVPESKQKAAGIEIQGVAKKSLKSRKVVPAKLQFDQALHVEVRAAAEGIVQKIAVTDGQQVEAKQPVAILSTPELSVSRNLLRSTEQQRSIAEQALKWQEETASNVNELISRISEGKDLTAMEDLFAAKTMGAQRGELVAAYTRLTLAEKLLNRGQMAAEGGAVAQRTIDERQSEFTAAKATLLATCEQARFEVQQNVAKAKLAYDDANRQVAAAEKKARLLFGISEHDDTESMTTLKDAAAENSDELIYRSPLAGTVIQRIVSPGERVQVGQAILLIGNLQHLWVVADLRPQDWDLLELNEKAPLSVEVVGMEKQKVFPAIWHHIAGNVNANTGAIEMVAQVNNPDGWLRPGMFVRLVVEIDRTVDSLVVPESALYVSDGKSYVFVAKENETFQMVAVEAEGPFEGMYSVKSGLNGDERIVTKGVFVVASEALLEKEE